MQTIAIHALTLTIAIVAVVFAVWPVIGDAPWEEEVVVVPTVDRTKEIRCEAALELREATILEGFRRDGPSRTANEREINRFC